MEQNLEVDIMANTFWAPASNVTPKAESKEDLTLARADEKSALYDLANKLTQEVQIPVENMRANKAKMDPNSATLANFQEILNGTQDVASQIKMGLGIVAEVVKQVAQANNPAASSEEADQVTVGQSAPVLGK